AFGSTDPGTFCLQRVRGITVEPCSNCGSVTQQGIARRMPDEIVLREDAAGCTPRPNRHKFLVLVTTSVRIGYIVLRTESYLRVQSRCLARATAIPLARVPSL